MRRYQVPGTGLRVQARCGIRSSRMATWGPKAVPGRCPVARPAYPKARPVAVARPSPPRGAGSSHIDHTGSVGPRTRRPSPGWSHSRDIASVLRADDTTTNKPLFDVQRNPATIAGPEATGTAGHTGVEDVTRISAGIGSVPERQPNRLTTLDTPSGRWTTVRSPSTGTTARTPTPPHRCPGSPSPPSKNVFGSPRGGTASAAAGAPATRDHLPSIGGRHSFSTLWMSLPSSRLS